jgi:murein DD-endopeptidase MepM/ murein hydrolase activator NlpD
MTRSLLLVALVAVLVAGLPAAAGAVDDVRFDRFPQPAADTAFEDDYGRVAGRYHRGNDIFGQKGDPVVAVAGGIVTRVDDGRTAGNYVVIEHIGGWETWYLHLNNDSPGTDNGRLGPDHAVGAKVEVGWWIPAGAIVGFVGDSGNAEGTQPHTHFELRIDGDVVNPFPYLLRAWTLEKERAERSGVVR